MEQSGEEIETIDDIKQEEHIDKGLVIFAVDSMAERIRLGEIYKDKDIYIIDGRMGGLSMEIQACKASEYLDTTVAPEDADPTPCTAKAIGFNCAVIGGLIANYVRKFVKGTLGSEELYFDFENVLMLKKSTPPVVLATEPVGASALLSEAMDEVDEFLFDGEDEEDGE